MITAGVNMVTERRAEVLKAFSHGIVMSISETVHASLKIVRFQEGLPLMARVLTVVFYS